jgi:aldose 1-epimerase
MSVLTLPPFVKSAGQRLCRQQAFAARDLMLTRFFALTSIVLAPAVAAQYSVHRDGTVIHLEDTRNATVVSILPGTGNTAVEMKVNGTNVLWFPSASIEEFEKKPAFSGIPFLAPFANRLDEPAFYANGNKYMFNPELGNVRWGPNKIPIHGFLTYVAGWQVKEMKADDRSAWVTSKLDVYRNPQWMAQFPFAHTIEMTYRLQNGALEVATKIENLSTEQMPVAIGFHPYFQLTDAPRDDWTISVGARSEWLLSKDKIPTGETRPIEKTLPNPQGTTLKGLDIDHVFGDLIRDKLGRAVMSVHGKTQKIEVLYGPKYKVAVVYAPLGPNRNFICFEPMAGITDSMNLAHRGQYSELQSIPAGESWQESFWIRPSGFTR